MTALNLYRPITPIQFVLKIREIAANSWWVYRHEMGSNGTLKPTPRVVFFGRSRNDAEQWIDTQRQEATVYMLSGN
ncbi:MAG: hypothetical protein V7731_07620 [Amphritea sp.]